MIVFEAGRALAVATVVWLAWRVVLWRRNGVDTVRELVVAVTFVWSLVIVRLTMFPLYVIFYDWRPRITLVPFASILQLVRETSGPVAFRNIAGNLVLFAPLGVLLPLLFPRMRRAGPAAWRFAAISLAIEGTQFLTRARSVDIDDVILNTAGAMVGWAAFWVGQRVLARSRRAGTLLERVAAPAEREPLRAGLLPIAVTMLLTVPVMVGTLVQGTMSGADIVDDVLAGWPDGDVVARTEVAADTYLLAASGPEDAERLRLHAYNRVLPGRYSPEAWGEYGPATGSRYGYSISTFNTAKADRPTVYIWGVNLVDATVLEVSGNGVDARLPLQGGDYFVVGVPFDPDAPGVSETFTLFTFRFLTADDRDVTDQVPLDQN